MMCVIYIYLVREIFTFQTKTYTNSLWFYFSKLKIILVTINKVHLAKFGSFICKSFNANKNKKNNVLTCHFNIKNGLEYDPVEEFI